MKDIKNRIRDAIISKTSKGFNGMIEDKEQELHKFGPPRRIQPLEQKRGTDQFNKFSYRASDMTTTLFRQMA